MRKITSIILTISTIFCLCSCSVMNKTKESKMAEYEVLKAAIAEDNFNMVLTQSVPKQGSFESFSDGKYIIRVRKGSAEVFLPGLSDNGFAQFGGSYTEGTEVVRMNAKRTSDDAKGNHRFVLTSMHGTNDYEIKLDINDNGQGKVTINRKPYYTTRYYATVETPYNQQ